MSSTYNTQLSLSLCTNGIEKSSRHDHNCTSSDEHPPRLPINSHCQLTPSLGRMS